MWGKSSGSKSGQRKWGGEQYFESSVTLGSYQYYADPSLSLSPVILSLACRHCGLFVLHQLNANNNDQRTCCKMQRACVHLASCMQVYVTEGEEDTLTGLFSVRLK